MNVTIRERDGVTILDVQGKIVGTDALELRRVIDEQFASAPEGKVKLLLNLDKAETVDTSGLAAFVAAYTATRQKGGRVALLKPKREQIGLIVFTKLITIYDRYDNEDEAVASFIK